MHFSSAIVLLSGLAVMALPSPQASIALDNVASFETYANANCEPQAEQQQNINSGVCVYLPHQSARVYYLEKNRANCSLEFFTTGGCTGTPSDVITEVPSGCIDVSTKFSYRAVCV